MVRGMRGNPGVGEWCGGGSETQTGGEAASRWFWRSVEVVVQRAGMWRLNIETDCGI